MRTVFQWFFAVFAVLAVSCAKETGGGVSTFDTRFRTLYARWAEEPESRTEIQPDGTTVMWSGEEHIKLFFSDRHSSEFVSPPSGMRKNALFSGIRPTVWGLVEYYSGDYYYPEAYALYPYDAAASCDGETISMTIPSRQQGKAGSFADNFFPAIGKIRTMDEPVAFYNVCGGTCFSVSAEGISSVTFKSVDGQALAGFVRAGFGADGLPEVRQVLAGVDSVVVQCPSGGFVPGKKYYAAFLPQTLPHGLAVKYHKGRMVASTAINRKIVINRSRFGWLDGLDRGLDYEMDTSPEVHDLDEIIPFEDKRIEAACVAAFDRNGDGHLSYDEAASALTIAGVFSGSRLYTSFDEFRFFTRITEIPANCFSGCALLKRISLPDGVKSIGEKAFADCISLERIEFGHDLYQIAFRAFSGCTALKHIHIPGLSQWLNMSVEYWRYDVPDNPRTPRVYDYTGFPFFSSREGHLYVEGKELTSLEIPPGYQTLHDFTFYACNGITSVSFPSGFQYWGLAFAECTNLKTVASPSIEDWLKINRSSTLQWYGYYLRDDRYFPRDGVFGDGGQLIIGGEEVTHLVIPEGITEIPDGAFASCTGIKELTIPSSLKTIGGRAFFHCTQLTRVNIPDIDVWLGLLFSQAEVTVYTKDYVGYDLNHPESGRSYKRTSSPFEFSGEGHLFVEGGEVTSVSLPVHCTEIYQNAFKYCPAITDITLPQGFKTVGKNAFGGCTSLTRVHVPSPQAWLDLSFNSDSSTPNGFFCSSEEGHILLPGDEELREIVIPEQTKSIGSYAFAYCTGLEKIVMEPTVPPTLGNNVFRGITCPIHVWTPCLPVYQATTGWKDYQHLLTANPDTP